MRVKGRQIVFVLDGGIGEGFLQLGDVTELAERLRGSHYGDADAYIIGEVFALDPLNELKPVIWTATGVGCFDHDDRAYPVVTVTFPDGAREQASYSIDGRA